MPDVHESSGVGEFDLDDLTIRRIGTLMGELLEIPADRRGRVLRILEDLLAIPNFDTRVADAQAYFRARRSRPGLRLHDGDTDG
jgi:hypothetical protein